VSPGVGTARRQVAAERSDLLVVVDVLSFSTAVVTAVQHGGIVYPCAWSDDPATLAMSVGAEVAVKTGCPDPRAVLAIAAHLPGDRGRHPCRRGLPEWRHL